MKQETLREWADRLVTVGKEFAGSGPLHRRQLSDIGIRIAVSGVRGKSTAVHWLYDIFRRRGHDTYAKVTGIDPMSMYNGTDHEIKRSVKVRLYENERELRRFDSIDVAIFENQGIRQYTTRLVNEQFIRPEVIFLTNVRKDHLDTLGSDRLKIARSLARSVPAGTHVVSGEQDSNIREYLEAELKRRDATIQHVQVPAAHRATPGAEIVYGLNPVLRAVGETPLDEHHIEAYLDRMSVEWTRLPSGRVYDASSANDIQSTELIRRQLVGGSGDIVEPLLYLREDRRGRTASFHRYLGALAERGLIEQAHVVGRDGRLFERHASFPVRVHDEASTRPEAVLDEALSDRRPVILMANTVSEFFDGLTATIEDRRLDGAADTPEGGGREADVHAQD